MSIKQSATVSSPGVVITADASGIAGTPHEFTCNITVPTAVNTSVTAEVTWFGPGIESGRHSITHVTAMDGSNMFISTLKLSPLNTSDAGLYTCSVTLSPANDSTFISPSTAGNDSQFLNVTGKHCTGKILMVARDSVHIHTYTTLVVNVYNIILAFFLTSASIDFLSCIINIWVINCVYNLTCNP